MANYLTDREINEVRVQLERGWGFRSIARSMGISRMTVKRYANQWGWTPDKNAAERKMALPGTTNEERQTIAAYRRELSAKAKADRKRVRHVERLDRQIDRLAHRVQILAAEADGLRTSTNPAALELANLILEQAADDTSWIFRRETELPSGF